MREARQAQHTQALLRFIRQSLDKVPGNCSSPQTNTTRTHKKLLSMLERNQWKKLLRNDVMALNVTIAKSRISLREEAGFLLCLLTITNRRNRERQRQSKFNKIRQGKFKIEPGKLDADSVKFSAQKNLRKTLNLARRSKLHNSRCTTQVKQRLHQVSDSRLRQNFQQDQVRGEARGWPGELSEDSLTHVSRSSDWERRGQLDTQTHSSS